MSTEEHEVAPHPAGDDEDAWVAWASAMPVSRTLGLRATAVGADVARFAVDEPVLRNSRGAMHGGLLTAIADHCAGIAAIRTVPGERVQCATAALAAQFLRPAQAPLTVAARVTHHGRRIAYVTVEAHDAAGAPCLLAQVTLSFRPR